jgi:hypothetical protein
MAGPVIQATGRSEFEDGFTKMLRFDENFSEISSKISLQLLKLLSIKKREILEKSHKNKIVIISGFNGGHRNKKKSPG